MRAQRGFSLVELLIAIVLGLLVTDAMVAMFVGVRSASRTTEGVAGLSDSGRFALDSIEQVVRGAGNLACDSTAPVAMAGGVQLIRVESDLNAGASALISNYDQPLSGYEAVGTAPGAALTISATPSADTTAGDWVSTAALGGVMDAALINPPVPSGETAPTGALVKGSDVLVVHETMPGSKPSYTAASASGQSSFTVSSPTTFAAANQIGVISNCAQSEVFQVGGFTPATGLVTLTGATGPGNIGGTLDPNMDFEAGAQVAPVDVSVFYIGVGADGDGALFRYEGKGGVLGGPLSSNQELVPDVENMQILYGVETAASAGTQSADQYVTADAVATKSLTGDFNGVISVKIALLVASPPAAVPKGAAVASSPPLLLGDTWSLSAADNRLRKVYEQTMFLRNMSP
ncbi:MAG TPA: PilW family protein [Steroidobacteraceae bacterium]|nr:PilW family protein [Steroidobacteraceae bacterium]